MKAKIIRYLKKHAGLTFILMGLAFFLFGLFSLNLIFLLKSNIDLFLQYGTMVIDDGALRQLFELLAMATWVLRFIYSSKRVSGYWSSE